MPLLLATETKATEVCSKLPIQKRMVYALYHFLSLTFAFQILGEVTTATSLGGQVVCPQLESNQLPYFQTAPPNFTQF